MLILAVSRTVASRTAVETTKIVTILDAANF